MKLQMNLFLDNSLCAVIPFLFRIYTWITFRVYVHLHLIDMSMKMKLQIPPATNTVVDVRKVNDEPLLNHDRDNIYVLHIDIEETSMPIAQTCLQVLGV